MRPPTQMLTTTLVLLAGLTPAAAQLSGGVGSSNNANQSFQLQNQLRGIQQQQTVQGNESRMKSQRDQLFDSPRANGAYIRSRR